MFDQIKPGTLILCVKDKGATPYLKVGEIYVVQKVYVGFHFDQVTVRADDKWFDLCRFEILQVPSEQGNQANYLIKGAQVV